MAVEETDGRLVEAGLEHRLGAAGQDGDPATALAMGLEGAGLIEGRAGGNLHGRQIDHRLQAVAQQRQRADSPFKGLASIAAPSAKRKRLGIGQHGGENPAQEPVVPGPRIGRLDIGAGMVDEMHVMHAGGTGGHAGQAREAAVDVLDHFRRGRLPALQHVLHQVDAPARRIEFVAEQEIGRAGGGAEAAMNAGAENPLRTGHGGISELIGREIGLHDVNSQRPLPAVDGVDGMDQHDDVQGEIVADPEPHEQLHDHRDQHRQPDGPYSGEPEARRSWRGCRTPN